MDAAVRGMKDPRGAGTARHEPDLALAAQEQACVAGGEGAFIGEGRQGLLPIPVCSSVIRGADLGGALKRVAHHDAVRSVPEGDAVEEALRVRVCELKRPVLT